MSPEIVQIRREMGLGHDEFFRLLPHAIENRDWSLAGNRIVIRDRDGLIKIDFSPETQRILGALSLPVTNLEFHFEGLAGPAIEQFMNKFDLSFRRGGG